MANPRSFIAPCSIGNVDLGLALCNLEASFNLILLSIFKKLRLVEAQLIKMAIQFSNKSIERSKGKFEDVLVMVDKFLFFANFVILDYKANRQVPISLWGLLL